MRKGPGKGPGITLKEAILGEKPGPTLKNSTLPQQVSEGELVVKERSVRRQPGEESKRTRKRKRSREEEAKGEGEIKNDL